MNYWGEPDSSISFCEENYAISPYIAEYYNTISSISFIVVGIPFLWGHLYDIAGASIIIGFGSIMLHGTLRYYGQWVDEIGMLMMQFYGLRHFRRLSNIYLVVLMGVYLRFSHYYICFFALFGGLLVLIWKEMAKIKPPSYVCRCCVPAGTYCFIIGFSCWCCDHIFCEQMKGSHLHAYWHIFSALSLFFYMLAFRHQHEQ